MSSRGLNIKKLKKKSEKEKIIIVDRKIIRWAKT